MIPVYSVFDQPVVVGVVCRPTNQRTHATLRIKRRVVLSLELPEGKGVGLAHSDHAEVVLNHLAHFLLAELKHVIVLVSHLGKHLPLEEGQRRAVQIGLRDQLEDGRRAPHLDVKAFGHLKF